MGFQPAKAFSPAPIDPNHISRAIACFSAGSALRPKCEGDESLADVKEVMRETIEIYGLKLDAVTQVTRITVQSYLLPNPTVKQLSTSCKPTLADNQHCALHFVANTAWQSTLPFAGEPRTKAARA